MAVTSERGQPSPREREVAKAVREHGSATTAATALGISRVTVEATLSRFHQRVCDKRITDLEAEVAQLRGRRRTEDVTDRLERAVGRFERAMMPVSHRRIADGGTHASTQRREAANGRS